MMGETNTQYRPMRPWLRVLLVGSLALNLLFAGLAAGIALRFGEAGGRPPPSVGAALYRSLPDPDRKALRGEIRRMHGDGDHRARHRAEALAVAQALRAEPFDPAALEALVAGHLDARNSGLAEVQASWLARVAAMDSAARLAYADRLTAAFEGGARERRWFKRREGRGAD